MLLSVHFEDSYSNYGTSTKYWFLCVCISRSSGRCIRGCRHWFNAAWSNHSCCDSSLLCRLFPVSLCSRVIAYNATAPGWQRCVLCAGTCPYLPWFCWYLKAWHPFKVWWLPAMPTTVNDQIEDHWYTSHLNLYHRCMVDFAQVRVCHVLAVYCPHHGSAWIAMPDHG